MLATCSQDDLLRMIQTIGVPTFAMDVLDDNVFRYAGINGRLEEMTGLSTSLVSGKCAAGAQNRKVENDLTNCARSCM